MTPTMKKEEAHSLVENMPETATWDDLIHEIYVRQVMASAPLDLADHLPSVGDRAGDAAPGAVKRTGGLKCTE